MGAGASMEEDYTHTHPPEPTDPQGTVLRHTPSSSRAMSRANSRPLSRTGSNASGQWRKALRNPGLAQSKLRKMRAAALGRKSSCTVTLNKTGFSLQHIQICEGQVISFRWEDNEGKGFNITQVVHDGDQYKPVVGGYNSGPVCHRGFFEQQFNLEGEYKFVSVGLRCTPLTVEVYPRKDIEAALTDEGFLPKLIRVDESSSVKWMWSGCSVPHALTEVKYSHKNGTLVQKEAASRPIPTKAGSCRREFKKVGLYYFQTEGSVPGEMHTCLVHVRERQAEFRVEIQDRAFSPSILVIQEGDRVWWWWDKAKCKKLHCPYEIDLPAQNHASDESYKPKKGGFKWPQPTKSGLLSHEFFDAGVYYFSDHNFDEAAEYIGTIIVKPKQREHFIELSAEGFDPDLVYVESGDRIWWDWVTDEVSRAFSIMEVEKCISPIGGRPAIENEAAGEGSYSDMALERLKFDTGLETVQAASIGVYHFKVVENGHSFSTCTIISRSGPKNHTIHVTDNGFEPKVVTIHAGDRVWWVWQEGSKQHNIIQVSHQGNHIAGGFSSGAPIDCPSAFVHQYQKPGVYYYISNSLPKLFGAIVVTSQPKVHEIQCSSSAIIPDPLPISLNDVVAWIFHGLRQNDLCQVATVDQVLDAQNNSPSLVPARRCLNRLFTERGVYHFASKAFVNKQGYQNQHDVEDHRISSILVDDQGDSTIIRVDSKGFHPENITIKKGNSILWTWKDSGEEAHNIIHVNTPQSESPLSAIQGGMSFNSGRPIPRNSFLYTFDDPGMFCVASQGAPGFACTIKVLNEEIKTMTPQIVSEHVGGTVEKFHVVKLLCNTPNAQIFFTTDGSLPELHRRSAKIYDPSKGVVMKNSGLGFVRAVAVSEGAITSDVYTSKRFWVLSGEDMAVSSPEPEPEPASNSSQYHWWNCVPQIRAVLTKPGEMEVFWETPPNDSRFMIRGYQLFLNGVSYCVLIPPHHTSVTVVGLAGGRLYEVILEAYPADSMFLPHKSNKLMMNCPRTSNTGGPMISLETTQRPDTMAIVWMSISTAQSPIEGYRVYLNGQMCGNQVVPDADSDRCKVVIEGCQLNFVYRIVVAAIPGDGSSPKMSNEMEVTLPLDTQNIRLPPTEVRTDDEDLYREYIEVHESGEPAANQTNHTCEIPDQRSSRAKKRGSRTVVVTVQEESHLSLPDTRPVPTEPTPSTPVIGASDEHVPAPIVQVNNRGMENVVINWQYQRALDPQYRLLVNVVNVIGSKFSKDVDSNISFECLQEDDSGAANSAIQHCWNVLHGSECVVRGLLPSTTYIIYVVSNYALTQSQQPCEIQAKSQPVKYTTLGPPPAPRLKIIGSDLYQATLSWDVHGQHKDIEIQGFNVLVDGQPLGNSLNKNIRQTIIDNLQPGRTVRVTVVSLSDNSVGNSNPSNVIKVVCPHKPPVPLITQQPSYKIGSVIVAWEQPEASKHAACGEDIIYYKVYIDGQYQGEVKATSTCNRNGYQYYLTNLKPGHCYDINIRSYSGQPKVDPTSDTVYCISESDLSNTVPVMCPAPPKSPHLRLDGMHLNGIDVTWEMPQQYGDAAVSGYQMLKDGKVYGSIMPPDVHSLRIKEISLGDRIELQILALTDHPVGREVGTEHEPDGQMRTDETGQVEVYLGDRYSACTPGPKLVVHYTGLVEPPGKVWCEHITGHSAMIVWSKDQEPRPHFVPADNYQVTWWPADQGDNEVNSQQIKDDHLLITSLKPNTHYNVVVEARRLQKYSEIDEAGRMDEDYLNTFILTAKSDHLSIQTASPPHPPTNLGIVATTCHSIQVAWDCPVERGVEIIGIRVDAIAVQSHDRHKHSCTEVVPSATSAIIDNLSEKTEYLVTVSAITDEYFDQLPPGHELKTTRILPKDKVPKEDIWLPSTSVISMTSGTDAPSDVKVKCTTVNSVTLSWKPAVVYGSNRLQGTVVRWAEGRFRMHYHEEGGMANHHVITADSNQMKIDDLQPGMLYKFVVEAVVSVKTTLEAGSSDPQHEKQNRRTTHVMSRPVLVRTRAPCEPPCPLVTGYTTNTIHLYWEKPLLYSVIGRDINDNPKYLKFSLEGYRLMINDKPHMRLAASAQSCTLIKCKPGKTYKIVLIAMTCTEEVKRERKKRMKGTLNSSGTLDESFTTVGTNKTWETVADDFDNDESPSLPLEVTIPRLHDGFLSEINATYLKPVPNLNAPKDHKDIGDIQLDWALQGVTDIVRQFDLTWKCQRSGETQKKVLEPGLRNTVIPVNQKKCIYDLFLEGEYNQDVAQPFAQKVQVLIPGPPDPPEIWTKSVDDNEFVIEWGQPRCYAVKIKGYQVYMNGKKIGNQLSSHHRKAVVPCKPKRQYRVNLVALSADNRFQDSEMSNTLLINTGTKYASALLQSGTVDQPQFQNDIDDDFMTKVIRVTDSTIHLDWCQYTEVEGLLYYRLVWSSVAQPAEKELKLPAGEKSCVIHQCYPGTNHFIRLYAMGERDQILDKSRQITVQTCAPPDTPNITLRACNFKYIAIQWEKPAHFGDAIITGYKIYVNGVVEALLGPDQFTFTFTHGQWCREYVFQVQALTASEKLHSKPSEPLVVVWPGVQPPVIRRVPSVSANTVKITWDHPTTTEGVKVKQYKVVVLDEDTERAVQVISPIHPSTYEADIHNLKQGSYLVYLEIHVHGSTDVVKSEVIRIQPTLTPDPPHINVTVVGLEERRAIEKVLCGLINKRDRLLNILGNQEAGSVKQNDEDQTLAKAAERLSEVEDKLDDCLQSLEYYTGHLLAHVSWTCPQSNPDLQITGYKVLVDGKQYGTTLHNGIKSVRVKLDLEKTSHKISMVSVCDHPHTTSIQSNTVELMTEPFLPFSFYMLFGQDKTRKGKNISYSSTLNIERKQMRRPINQGLLKRQVPPPSCSVLDVFEGEYRQLFPPSGPRAPTAILFWSKQQHYSTRSLAWFVRFARQHSSQFEFMAVACEQREITAAVRQELLKVITNNGWREDNCIRHVISQAFSETTPASPGREEKKGHDCYYYLKGRPINNINDLKDSVKEKDIMQDSMECTRRHTIYVDLTTSLNQSFDHKQTVTSSDVTQLFGVLGVPTIVIVHPQDYIAWKGRYCAFDYGMFEHFMRYVFAQTMNKVLPQPDPWDTNIDIESLDGAKKQYYNEKDMLIHRPATNQGMLKTSFVGTPTTIHMNGTSTPAVRPQSGKVFYKVKKDSQGKITVNIRPYSATLDSPYTQKLRHRSPPRRSKSGRKVNKSAYY